MNINIGSPQAIWEIGKRDNQEDALYPELGTATSNERVFVLCDGMGGHEHGEVASQTVSSTIYKYLYAHWPEDGMVTDRIITDAIRAAYEALDVKDNDAVKKMGTTLTLLVLHEGGCTAAHIGDSRIYHLRTAERRLLYRSRDHSLVTDLYQAGEISYEEMSTSPQKNIITKAMQPGEDNRVRPDIVHIGNLRQGDYLYMCSDGMLEQMDDSELMDLLCANKSDETKRQRLIKATAGNSDNHSAFLIHIREVTMDENETIQDDESTARCNFLNIRPVISEAEIVEDNQPTGTKNRDNSLSITRKKDRRWLFLLLLAVILTVVFYAWMSLSAGEDNNKKQPEKQDSINMEPTSSPSQRKNQFNHSSETDVHMVSPYKPDKNE